MALTLDDVGWNQPDKAFEFAKERFEAKTLTGELLNTVMMSVEDIDALQERLADAGIEANAKGPDGR